jgi:hypothetical protein
VISTTLATDMTSLLSGKSIAPSQHSCWVRL